MCARVCDFGNTYVHNRCMCIRYMLMFTCMYMYICTQRDVCRRASGDFQSDNIYIYRQCYDNICDFQSDKVKARSATIDQDGVV